MPIFFGCQDSTHDKGLIQEPVMVMDPDGRMAKKGAKSMAVNQ